MDTCYIADASIANLGSDVLLHLRTKTSAESFDVHTFIDGWIDPMVGVCDVDAAEAFAAAASAGRTTYIVNHVTRGDGQTPRTLAESAACVAWKRSGRIRPRV